MQEVDAPKTGADNKNVCLYLFWCTIRGITTCGTGQVLCTMIFTKDFLGAQR